MKQTEHKTINQIFQYMESGAGFCRPYAVKVAAEKVKEDFSKELKKNLPASLHRDDRDVEYYNPQKNFKYVHDFTVECNKRKITYHCGR